MPKFVLAGVDAHIGLIAASYTLALSRPGDEVVITSPRPAFMPRDLLKSWLARGAKVLMVSYDDTANLIRAFTGADAVAFISAPGALAGRRRREQHANVVEACREAGVPRIVYTSLCNASGDRSEDVDEGSATDGDCADTERLIKESGLAWRFQRSYVNPHGDLPVIETPEGGLFPLDVTEEEQCTAKGNWELVLGTLLLDK